MEYSPHLRGTDREINPDDPTPQSQRSSNIFAVAALSQRSDRFDF